MKSIFTPAFLLGFLATHAVIYTAYHLKVRTPAALPTTANLHRSLSGDPVVATYQSARFNDDLYVLRAEQVEQQAADHATQINRRRGGENPQADLYRSHWQQRPSASRYLFSAAGLRSLRMNAMSNAILQMAMMMNTYRRSLTPQQYAQYREMFEDLRLRLSAIASDSPLLPNNNISADSILADLPAAPAAPAVFIPAAAPSAPLVAAAAPVAENDSITAPEEHTPAAAHQEPADEDGQDSPTSPDGENDSETEG